MKGLSTISEKDILNYAIKGLCERILKAPFDELDALNAQFYEMYHRRQEILADEREAPF